MFNHLVTLEEHNSYSVELWSLVSSGALRTNIHNEYPFTAEGVRQAHIDLTSGTTSGKLLIKVKKLTGSPHKTRTRLYDVYDVMGIISKGEVIRLSNGYYCLNL